MSGLARSAPVDCAEDTALTRMRFLAEHLHDLQSLRWMVPQVCLIVLPLVLPQAPPLRHGGLVAAALAAATAAWFFAFRAVVRRRYGRTTLSPAQRLRQQMPSPAIAGVILLFVVGAAIDRFALHDHNSDWYIGGLVVVWMLRRALDRTNLRVRRVAYAVALALSLGCYAWLTQTAPMADGEPGQWVPMSVFGTVLLSLSLLDFWLLRGCVASATESS